MKFSKAPVTVEPISMEALLAVQVQLFTITPAGSVNWQSAVVHAVNPAGEGTLISNLSPSKKLSAVFLLNFIVNLDLALTVVGSKENPLP